jgi:hypothetical protein
MVKAPLGRKYVKLLRMGNDDNGGALTSEDPELRSQILHLAMEAFRRDEISQGRLLEVGRKLDIDGQELIELAQAERSVSPE